MLCKFPLLFDLTLISFDRSVIDIFGILGLFYLIDSKRYLSDAVDTLLSILIFLADSGSTRMVIGLGKWFKYLSKLSLEFAYTCFTSEESFDFDVEFIGLLMFFFSFCFEINGIKYFFTSFVNPFSLAIF